MVHAHYNDGILCFTYGSYQLLIEYLSFALSRLTQYAHGILTFEALSAGRVIAAEPSKGLSTLQVVLPCTNLAFV
jgi:hypothetical protein